MAIENPLFDPEEEYPEQPPASWKEPKGPERLRAKYSEFYGQPGSTFDYLREKFGQEEAERAIRERGGRR
jgi:hypothetical protein